MRPEAPAPSVRTFPTRLFDREPRFRINEEKRGSRDEWKTELGKGVIACGPKKPFRPEDLVFPDTRISDVNGSAKRREIANHL